SFGMKSNISTQRILTPSQTWAGHSGNCIDLTVLLASCLESSGYAPLVVLVPGHAFLGVNGRGRPHYLEATMLGRADFEQALQRGSANHQALYLDADSQEDKRIVVVPEARKRGIYPLKY
ncbi:MAG TPA: hypothetical protein VGL40_08145, partial [Bacillota bacterium]